MKKIYFALFLLISATQARAQNHTPDSIIQITTILPGMKQPQTLTVEVIDGLAILDGDMILGRIEDLHKGVDERGFVIDDPVGDPGFEHSTRWGSGVIPYTIDPSFAPAYINLIHQAIDYINGSTNLLLKPHEGEFDRIRFQPSPGCSAWTGNLVIAGEQPVNLNDPGCGFKQIIHEIAHAAGFYHEQCRPGRNNFVTIHWDNIIPGKEHNFQMIIVDGTEIGPYDFESAMHYEPDAFSKNGQPTITANNGQAFGNATEYSIGDVISMNWMYPEKNCPSDYNLSTTIPSVQRPLHFETPGHITSTAAVQGNNNMMYDAGVFVQLNPGFEAHEGSTFHAVIDGCGGAYQLAIPPEVEEWMAAMQHDHQSPQDDQPDTKEKTEIQFSASPNPFTTSTTIAYQLDEPENVEIRIFNATGLLIATPVQPQRQEAGDYSFTFAADDLPAGVYFLVAQMGDRRVTKRLVRTQ
ncbi:MAG: T9SS C-terminal target domain-containing protein [Haliscomenobacteraceae bacterium CHB4]|nr:T9SS C-terminal target domain-containing protein [Haliscomenobacteraceae bacterium CHB4]